MPEEFFSFERALRELQMREDELKRLVSAGEIRAFRDGDQMKLRRDDIEKMRSRRAKGEEEVVDLGEEVPVASEEDPGMATAQISEEDTLLAEEEAGGAEALELPAEETVAAASAPTRARARAGAGRIEQEKTEGMGLRIALVGTAILLVLGGFVAYSASNVDASGLAGSVAEMAKGMMQPAGSGSAG